MPEEQTAAVRLAPAWTWHSQNVIQRVTLIITLYFSDTASSVRRVDNNNKCVRRKHKRTMISIYWYNGAATAVAKAVH